MDTCQVLQVIFWKSSDPHFAQEDRRIPAPGKQNSNNFFKDILKDLLFCSHAYLTYRMAGVIGWC